MKRSWVSKGILLFIAAVGLLLYQNLGRDSLFDWDEGIYAELGREMIERGNLLTPSWNYQPWLEKPPGIAWTTALGMTIAGINETGARLLMPLFALVTLWGVFLVGIKLKGVATGALAAVILASFDLFLSRSRAVNTDGALLAATTFTVWAALVGIHPALLGLIVAVGVWFKGLAGLLSLLIALPLFFKKPKYFLLSAFYLLLYTLPWHIYQYVVNGETFLTPYIREQVVRRAIVPIEFHLESRWFYLRYLAENLSGIMVLLSVLAALVILVKAIRLKKLTQPSVLVWWVLVPLLIFTAAKTRLFWYILPVYPAIALLVAYAVSYLSVAKLGKMALALITITFAVMSLMKVGASVELQKKDSVYPDRIQVAATVGEKGLGPALGVLVHESERTAEAILPANLRISSSFRYGGMPSVVYYYGAPVRYYYNVDEFVDHWKRGELPVVMLTPSDYNDRIAGDGEVVVTTPTFLGVRANP